MLPRYEEILKEKQRSLSQQTSVLAFFKSPSETRTAPPVLLDIADDDPPDLLDTADDDPPVLLGIADDDPPDLPTVQEIFV
jgi:hypothetical protein